MKNPSFDDLFDYYRYLATELTLSQWLYALLIDPDKKAEVWKQLGGGAMECCEYDGPCDNEDMEQCKTCASPMWCLCKRPEVRKMVRKLWGKKEGKP